MTENYNLAKTNNYRLEIYEPNNPKSKVFNFMIQDTNIPGISLSPTIINNSNKTFNIQDNKLQYEQLSIQLIINEDWSDYTYILTWMKRIIETENLIDEMKYMNLYLLNNNKIPISRIIFENAWPTSLSGIPLLSSSLDSTSIVCTVSFAFQNFDIIKII